MAGSTTRGGHSLARWGSLALLALAGCGGSGGGGSALEAAAVSAPCVTAFAPVQTSMLSTIGLSSKTEVAVAVPLSQCVLDAQRNLTIGSSGCGPNVVIDQSFTGASALGKITIAADGKLAVPNSFGSLELDTTGISVAGSMSIGTLECPVGRNNPDSHMTVKFVGAPVASGGPTDMGSGSDKGIEVQSGGSLRLYGTRGVAPAGVDWTYLSQPAGPGKYQATDPSIRAPVPAGGASLLHLAGDVRSGAGAWHKGDWIVVATTSFSPFESEFVQIDSLQPGSGGSGTDVTLTQPLKHYHFGGADPGPPSDANYGASATTNFGIDERAEVGLISRNITFTADTPFSAGTAVGDQSNHWGGEIRILAGFAEASIQGVELEKFGKARLGSYPIHFHMVGAPQGRVLVDSNSIHHSYNKCTTLHMSQNIAISNNVCARAIGHLFYQEAAQEQGTSYTGNLGIGAMSNSFGIDPSLADDVKAAYWGGDNLATANGYNGLNVPNMDNQANPVHGACYTVDANGGLVFNKPTPCASPLLYVEQATGFWIGNPGTVLVGNSIAGCQGEGKGYWYASPTVGFQKHEPVGNFLNNRVHGCFDGLFGENDEGVTVEPLRPQVGGDPNGLNIIGHFKGLTATRIRNRGVWMRPLWYTVESGRFATTRDAVTLVSSGGLDGNAPGVWALLKDSVLAGISMNNVDRWGPCATNTVEGPGCVDWNKNANDFQGKGYQTPRWNSAGYMIYDGPVRIAHDRFVNYLRDISPWLTVADQQFLKSFNKYPDASAKAYEGDAALGWFQSNQSAYPTATTSRDLSFDNVDLRHQIYTDKVNLAAFADGDKNTAIIDLDGSLSGLRVADANGVTVPGEYPISLNNLEFNHSGNAVDECLSTGPQDAQFEGRPTSIMSPANIATLEFEADAPELGFNVPQWQDMKFTKDTFDAGAHQSMSLQSRNGQWIWEPKVASGMGYTISAQPSTSPSAAGNPPVLGMRKQVRVGFTDAVKSNMSPQNPFYVRVGICYSNAQGRPPSGNFTISRGYKSWGGNGVNYNLPEFRPFFTILATQTTPQSARTCHNLDYAVRGPILPDPGNPNDVGDPVNRWLNLDPPAPSTGGCPAAGLMGAPTAGCPAGSTLAQSGFCEFPGSELTPAGGLSAISNADGTPVDPNKYFYDSTTGMLFFYVQQTAPNAHGAAPLGACHTPAQSGDDPACPDANDLDTYYGCPAQGCSNYSVVLNDPDYTPGPSVCDALAGGDIYSKPGYTLTEPVQTNRLAAAGSGGAFVEPVLTASPVSPYQHWVPMQQPVCDGAPVDAVAGPTADAGHALVARPQALGPVRRQRDDLFTRVSALVRDPFASFHSQHAHDIDSSMLSQICTARGG